MPTPSIDPALYAYPDSDRPWIRVNFVSTVDGSTQGSDGVSGSLGSPADKEAFDAMRAAADVVLVTAGTARAEDYGPVDEGFLLLVSSSLDIGERLQVPGVGVLTTRDADPDTVQTLVSRGVEVWRLGATELDWSLVLDRLAERGLTKVLCEGGPSLVAQLADADLVDELCLSIVPLLVAGDGQRVAHGDTAVRRDLRLAHAVEVDGTLLTRWVRDR